MKQVLVKRDTVNIMALDAEGKRALGAIWRGLSLGNGAVTAHLEDTATPEEIVLVEALLKTHDETQLTPEQSKQIAQRHALKQARQAFDVPLVLEGLPPADALKAVVHRLTWLEEEVRLMLGE